LIQSSETVRPIAKRLEAFFPQYDQYDQGALWSYVARQAQQTAAQQQAAIAAAARKMGVRDKTRLDLGLGTQRRLACARDAEGE
jgi:hypothetical protein